MRTVAAVTTSRADWGIYRPVLRRIAAARELDLALYVTGTHLLPEFGETVREIEADGFAPQERIAIPMDADGPAGIARSMASCTAAFAKLFERHRPDILLLQGDRFEIHAVAVAALPFGIPIAHVHGGEITEGAMDDALRHALTKMAHLHFVATEEYGRRVRQLGEEDWRITVSGAPALDNLDEVMPATRQELEERFGLALDAPPLLVTLHPETLDPAHTGAHVAALLQALSGVDLPIVFTAPNADLGSDVIRTAIQTFVAAGPGRWLVETLGTANYFGLMRCAAAMVGNSSSGIVEAASFALPVVNIGDRQKGRVCGRNVIDADAKADDIGRALARATDPAFRRTLDGMQNPYGDGHAGERIVRVLGEVPLDRRLRVKRFADLGVPCNG